MNTPRDEHRDERVGNAISALPIAEDSPEFFTRLDAALRAPMAAATEEPRRGRAGAWFAVGAAACLVIGGATGAALANSASTTKHQTKVVHIPQATTLGFAPSPGWNTVSATWRFPHGLRQHMAWATNVPIPPAERLAGMPVHIMKTLPPRGIVIWVAAPNWDRPVSEYPRARLPLHLGAFPKHTGQYEMQPAPSVSFYGPYQVTANGRQLAAYIYFGSNPPTAANLKAAQAEVDRLQVPPAKR
jgi:hypothetical protein